MFALCALAYLGGCVTPGDEGPEVDVARTWQNAERHVPEVENPPVVVFLHGCSGITSTNQHWARLLRAAGYLVILPDSFSRRSRIADCDPSGYRGQRNPGTLVDRAEEAGYAASQLQKLRAPKRILMGHSEGGLAVQFWMGIEGYDAAIISGTSCNRITLPHNLPTLIIRYESDPWDSSPHQCRYWASERGKTQLHLVPGVGHDPAFDAGTQRRVLEFLKSL